MPPCTQSRQSSSTLWAAQHCAHAAGYPADLRQRISGLWERGACAALLRGGAAGGLGGDRVPGQQQRTDVVDRVLRVGHIAWLASASHACKLHAAGAAASISASHIQRLMPCHPRVMHCMPEVKPKAKPRTVSTTQGCSRDSSGPARTPLGRQFMHAHGLQGNGLSRCSAHHADLDDLAVQRGRGLAACDFDRAAALLDAQRVAQVRAAVQQRVPAVALLEGRHLRAVAQHRAQSVRDQEQLKKPAAAVLAACIIKRIVGSMQRSTELRSYPHHSPATLPADERAHAGTGLAVMACMHYSHAQCYRSD